MRDFAMIFRHAWELARKGAETFGGSARSYFRESLLLAYDQLKRNVTAKDLVKIMTGRYMSMSQIREEVNARFKKQTAKNIARRIWNMFRSPYVEIEKIKCESTGKYLYHLKHAQKKFFVSGAITRALKSVRPEKKKAIKPRPAMSRDEINSCRMANAFHKGCKTETLLTALKRRADYYAELEALTPEQRAEHDAGIAEFIESFGNSGQLNSPVITEGWVMVPKEPTRQMMAQGHFAMKGTDRGKFRRIYQAMITAAPALNKGGINAE
ncbi:hypothetical protein ACGG0V_000395 [Salmonella enterica]